MSKYFFKRKILKFIMFQIFFTPSFKKNIKKLLDKKEIEELENFIDTTLRIKGDIVGDQLSYPFLREKKISNKRIYYLVYKEIAVILLVESSSKKTQQSTIDEIKSSLPDFKKYVYEVYEKNKTRD